MKQYQVINGTSYNPRTPNQVIRVLEEARQNHTRLQLSFGETEGLQAGRDWLEESDCCGYVRRSMGPIKVPLLVFNRRSSGGCAVLDQFIVRIRLSAGGRVLYQHPTYHHGQMAIRRKPKAVVLADGRSLTIDLCQNGEVHASFETMAQARQLIRKLGIVAPLTL